jgi:hypothetical protein
LRKSRNLCFLRCQAQKLRKPRSFLKESRKIASFLMLPTSKNKEILQICFGFYVVKLENWGGLAELLHFWWCQMQKLKKSRRIVLFSNLQIDRQTDR